VSDSRQQVWIDAPEQVVSELIADSLEARRGAAVDRLGAGAGDSA
jgi:hypothetical protein